MEEGDESPFADCEEASEEVEYFVDVVDHGNRFGIMKELRCGPQLLSS